MWSCIFATRRTLSLNLKILGWANLNSTPRNYGSCQYNISDGTKICFEYNEDNSPKLSYVIKGQTRQLTWARNHPGDRFYLGSYQIDNELLNIYKIGDYYYFRWNDDQNQDLKSFLT